MEDGTRDITMLKPWKQRSKKNVVKGIRAMVLARKFNFKEKKKKWEEWDSNPPPLNQI